MKFPAPTYPARKSLQPVACGLRPFAFILVFTHLLISSASAQIPGTLRLFIDPGHEFSFVLDDKYRMQQREVTLPAGQHRFQFWAPTRRIVDTTLTVLPDIPRDFTLRLPYSDEYKVYQEQLLRYRNNRKLNRLLPMAATGVSAIVSVSMFVKYKNAHDQLAEDVDQYNSLTSPGAISRLKNETMPAHQADFNKAERNFIISTSITGGLAVLTTYLYVKSARMKVPLFEDKERLKFEGLAWVPGERGGTWAGGFTFNLVKR